MLLAIIGLINHADWYWVDVAILALGSFGLYKLNP